MELRVRNNGISKYRTNIMLASMTYFMDNMIQTESRKIKTFRFLLDTSWSQSGDLGYQTELDELPGHYTIAISKDSTIASAVSSLAHEFIHLNQALTGRLRTVPTGLKRGDAIWYWDNLNFGLNPYDRFKTREQHHAHLPWEAEAYDNQSRWASQYLETLNRRVKL